MFSKTVVFVQCGFVDFHQTWICPRICTSLCMFLVLRVCTDSPFPLCSSCLFICLYGFPHVFKNGGFCTSWFCRLSPTMAFPGCCTKSLHVPFSAFCTDSHSPLVSSCCSYVLYELSSCFQKRWFCTSWFCRRSPNMAFSRILH